MLPVNQEARLPETSQEVHIPLSLYISPLAALHDQHVGCFVTQGHNGAGKRQGSSGFWCLLCTVHKILQDAPASKSSTKYLGRKITGVVSLQAKKKRNRILMLTSRSQSRMLGTKSPCQTPTQANLGSESLILSQNGAHRGS